MFFERTQRLVQCAEGICPSICFSNIVCHCCFDSVHVIHWRFFFLFSFFFLLLLFTSKVLLGSRKQRQRAIV